MEDVVDRLRAVLAGRYEIQRELAHGGMGTVYLAVDVKHERQLAVKVLRPELASALGAERFLREIRITARLDHPHILTLIDSGESAGYLWYALPYVRGESLRHRLGREGQLPIEEALAITRQVASALEYAHRHDVVHRDIKPENILLHEGEAVVADFGIALALREAGGDRLTASGVSVGTPQYMSPEQATEGRSVDRRTDVYALGAVLYEMLAGEPPFTGPTARAVIAKLLTERPTRLRTVRDTVSAAVDEAVARALSKTPADRFPSAAAFVAALETVTRPRRLVAAGALRWLFGGVGVTLAALIAAMVWRQAINERSARSDRLVRTRITYSGDAAEPRLSPDGTRLAYAQRVCPADASCRDDIVIQDVEGAGTARVVAGLQDGSPVAWTRDSRYLLFREFRAGRPSMFAVAALGGLVRHLGCCHGDLLGRGDTVILGRAPEAADTLSWLRLVTTADGMVRDSVPLRHAVGVRSVEPMGSADGRWIFATLWADEGGPTYTARLLVLDRAGRVRDSLRPFSGGALATPYPGALVAAALRPDRTYDLLRYRVSENGEIRGQPDTLMWQLSMAGGVNVAPTGALTYADGPEDVVVWALRREGRSMRFVARRLTGGPGIVSGRLCPNAAEVLIYRMAGTPTREETQLAVMPFDSGPERRIAAYQSGDWASCAADGRALLLGRLDGDSLAISEVDPASGSSRPVARLGRAHINGFRAVPGGGWVILADTRVDVRHVGIAGVHDTVLRLPTPVSQLFAVSPDGKVVAFAGSTSDSVVLLQVTIGSGMVNRLAAPGWIGDGEGPAWMADGSLLVPIEEATGMTGLYRVGVGDSALQRVGTVPLQGRWQSVRFSADGQRAVRSVSEVRTDIYMIRDFGKLLGK